MRKKRRNNLASAGTATVYGILHYYDNDTTINKRSVAGSYLVDSIGLEMKMCSLQGDTNGSELAGI